MVGHGGSSAGSYLADPTSPIPSHCASIVATSTVRVKKSQRVPHYFLHHGIEAHAGVHLIHAHPATLGVCDAIVVAHRKDHAGSVAVT